MTDVLVDVKNGNGNRRILSATNELTAPLAYEINEIVVAYAIFLRLVMQYAEREYGIDNDTQTLAVKGTRSRPVDCLHPEEVEALFKVLPHCSTLEQVIVMGLLNTGMRRGELAGLTWEDIDFDHCTVHVDKSLLIVNKGYHLTTTKEDNVRDITLLSFSPRRTACCR